MKTARKLKQLILLTVQAWKIKRQIKRNLRTIRPHQSCRTLPFKKYWHAIETGDLRHILDNDTLPEYYDISVLQNAWDIIMSEYETISGTFEYSSHIRNVNIRYSRINNLNIMKGAYLLMKLGSEKSIEYLKAIGIKVDKVSVENINYLRSEILRMATRMEIDNIIKRETGDTKKMTFEQIMVSLEMALGRSVDENMTIVKYIETVKAINKRNEEITKRYGRKN